MPCQCVVERLPSSSVKPYPIELNKFHSSSLRVLQNVPSEASTGLTRQLFSDTDDIVWVTINIVNATSTASGDQGTEVQVASVDNATEHLLPPSPRFNDVELILLTSSHKSKVLKIDSQKRLFSERWWLCKSDEGKLQGKPPVLREIIFF